MSVIKYWDDTAQEWKITSIGLNAAASISNVDITESKTLALTDADKMIKCTSSSTITITVPPNSSVAFPTNTEIVLLRYGSGAVTVAKGSGVTVNSSGGKLSINAQYEMASLKKIATDEWVLVGNLTT